MTRQWTPTPAGFELQTGALILQVTDQTDRNCGWVWHVSAEVMYGRETLEQKGGHADAESAKEAGKTWARAYCLRTLCALDGSAD